MKKAIIFLIILGIIGGTSYYFIASQEVVLEEASPLDQAPEETTETTPAAMRPELKQALDEMAKEDADNFMEEMKISREKVMRMEEKMPAVAKLVAEGKFQAHAHGVEGKALLISEGDKKTLRFENFDTLNGPNLHIYLSTDTKASDFIDLGKIRATTGNVNYEIPGDVDTDKYNKVLVWCKPFHILFSYAELK